MMRWSNIILSLVILHRVFSRYTTLLAFQFPAATSTSFRRRKSVFLPLAKQTTRTTHACQNDARLDGNAQVGTKKPRYPIGQEAIKRQRRLQELRERSGRGESLTRKCQRIGHIEKSDFLPCLSALSLFEAIFDRVRGILRLDSGFLRGI